MKYSKQVTVNIGQYQSVKLGVEDAPSFQAADDIIVEEIKRMKIPVNNKIKQCLQWETNIGEWV